MSNNQKMKWKTDKKIEYHVRGGEQSTYDEAKEYLDQLRTEKKVPAKIRRRPDGSFDIMTGTEI